MITDIVWWRRRFLGHDVVLYAGDALTQQHLNQRFTTKDRDNDHSPYGNCADWYVGGWWYNNCYAANLNGESRHGDPMNGVYWSSYDDHGTVELVEMLIRPQTF